MNRLFLKRKNRRSLLISCLLMVSACLHVHAGDIRYPVSSIPAPLLKKANVVKRQEEIRFEVVSVREAIYSRKVVLTILNEFGERYAAMVIGYDKLRKVISMEGALYDAQGIQIRKTKNKDIRDYSAVSDNNLYDDNRMKVLDFNYNSYPYTVEYEVEMKFSTTYGFPDWTPLSHSGVSVENSSYTLVTPVDYQARYKAFNYPGEPQTVTDKNRKITTWSVKNLPVLEKPFAAPVTHEITTAVLFAPSEFEMEGYRGNAATWQELGKFSLDLNKERDQLPDPVVAKVKELTAGLKNDREKVQVLYHYLQQNTRYISISLGIGSLQPFDAGFVSQKGYGDCKALSNYMYSLLKAAGIKSYHALVNGGYDAEDKIIVDDFPSHQFNHMVLFVPFEKDTMWLECTSQTNAPGYMGGFTGNRMALAITEDGGKLVRTPRYGIRENTQVRNIHAQLQPDGELNMTVETNYTGLQQDKLQQLQASMSRDKLKELLQEDLELASYDILDFKYQEKRGALPELDEQLVIRVNNYANITGKRLFIVPNILSPGGIRLQEEERKVDFVFQDEFHNEDISEIIIPDGYQVEAAPADVTLRTKYGTYTSTARLEKNKIIYKRVREQFRGRFPASESAAISKFFSDIYKADRSRMVLVKVQ